MKAKLITIALTMVILAIVSGCGNDITTNNNGVAPVITKINPTNLNIGDLITVTGEGFGSSKGTSYLSFNNIVATDFVSWSDTIIVAKVPYGSISGKLSVTVSDSTSNQVNFTIIFPYVKIGNQIWMTQNLSVDHYRNGDLIFEVNDLQKWEGLKIGVWCNYNKDSALGAKYGKLYNWFAVNDPRGIAPVGWHVASAKEWDDLKAFLGDTNTAGGKLKTVGTIENGDGLWYAPNVSATNETGFCCIPSGTMDPHYEKFRNLGGECIFWTSTENNNFCADIVDIRCDKGQIITSNAGKIFGFSVRCIKD